MKAAAVAAMGTGLLGVLGGCLGAHGGAAVTGATTLTSGVADPCRGLAFDADSADPRCLHHGVGAQMPVPEGLRVTMAGTPVARSGYDAGLAIEMTNTTTEAIAVELDDSCGTFEGQASNEELNSFESDCFGMCAGGPEPHVLRVTLEPGGVVRKKVRFFAVQTRVMLDSHEECVTKTTGGLPPGDYALRVTLPWTDPIVDQPTVTRPKVLEARLSVTP